MGNDVKWRQAALGAEAVLLALFGALIGGIAGWSVWAVAGMGMLLMLLLALPSLFLLLWGRARSHVDFMSSLVGSIMGKAVVVGIAVALIEWQRWVPTLPFVFGMMAGWVGSFGFQFLVLRKTLPAREDRAAG